MAFNVLKESLEQSLILIFPNINKEFYIKTDASNIGLGAILSQDFVVNNEITRLPVAYAS